MKDYKSILYVATGACSYGLLATLVKYANQLGINFPAIFDRVLVFAGTQLLVETTTTATGKLDCKIKTNCLGNVLGFDVNIVLPCHTIHPCICGNYPTHAIHLDKFNCGGVHQKANSIKGKDSGCHYRLIGNCACNQYLYRNKGFGYKRYIIGVWRWHQLCRCHFFI